MSRLQSELWVAPFGEDLTSEPMLLSQLWQHVQNLLCDQMGKCRGVGQMTQLSVGSISNSVDGIGYLDTSSVYYVYYGTSTGLLIYVTGGVVYTNVMGTLAIPPTFASRVAAITGLITGNRVRMVPFGIEMIMVQDGASSNYYINPTSGLGGTLGVPDPVSAPTITSGAGAFPTGTWYYEYTYVDYLGRESDPSPVSAAFTSTGSSGPSITVPPPPGGYGSDHYVTANLYRTLNGQVGTFYQVVQTTAYPYSDSMTDAQISGNQTAPLPGENGMPLPGNQLCYWRNRMWMNVSGQPDLIQCSNYGSASQWSAIYIPGVYPTTSGLVIKLQGANSDYVVGFAPLSSILIVFKRYSVYSVLGYDASSFTVQEFKTTGKSGSVAKGCIAPDSIQVCDDLAIFLATDGVYAVDASGNMTKISKYQENGGIEAALVAMYTTTQGRTNMQNAVGWYVDRTYYLSIGTTIYAYNMDRQAWTEVVPSNFGSAMVQSANVMLAKGIPALALFGLNNSSPFGAYILDNYSANQNLTNIGLATQCLQDRSKVKTVARVRIYGTVNAFSSGTLTCFFDNYSEQYALHLASTQVLDEAARGVLFYQEFTPYAQGREVYFQLSLSGTGVILTHWQVDYVLQECQ